MTAVDVQALIAQALEARHRSYSPYSGYAVGAALLGASGRVYLGCNIENAAYGESICAERTAVVKAVSEGEREFVAIAVATANGGMPCGACRQVLNEFAPEIDLIVVDGEGREVQHAPLTTILPFSFGPRNLTLPSPHDRT
ncbi:MAG: cytidine deaminase [Anaerolineales bacterium]|nr:cytidine deaminase [Anaerolineales bacterium]